MILILIFYVLSINCWQLIIASNNKSPLCQLSLSVPLLQGEFEQFPNGSLIHQNVMYHSKYLWNDNNTLYGCICENQQKPCLRKCCDDDQVLFETPELSECIKANRSLIPQLLPMDHQLVNELKNLKNLSHHFHIINNKICPHGMYRLEPEAFEEDEFVLLTNGSLQTLDSLLPQSRFCLDWQDNLENISVLVCHQPEKETLEPENIYPIGVIISIPFLLATLVVYAVISELRNLYGITLMCYVGSLTAAYCFLVVERFIHHGHVLCEFIDCKHKSLHTYEL